MSLKILHLANDEKFIHLIADSFNAIENIANFFFIIVNDKSSPLRHINQLPDMKVVDKQDIFEFIASSEINNYDAIIVHYLDELKARIVLAASPRTAIVWSGWGGDYYDLIRFKQYSPKTLAVKKQILNQKTIFIRIETILKPILKQMLFTKILPKAIERFDYFSSPVPNDYDLVKGIHGFRAEYAQLNYANVERTFKPGFDFVNGSNILVGNSASLPNNHLNIFDLLANLNLAARNIIAPLSYGDSAYRNIIIEHGTKIFGDHFVPLVDFMPLQQYNELIGSCSIVVMGHKRQQALGNILIMLYKGAKVFLDEVSTVYTFLKEKGVYIFRLDEINEKTFNSDNCLTRVEVAHNRNILEQIWGEDVVANNLLRLVTKITEKRNFNA